MCVFFLGSGRKISSVVRMSQIGRYNFFTPENSNPNTLLHAIQHRLLWEVREKGNRKQRESEVAELACDVNPIDDMTAEERDKIPKSRSHVECRVPNGEHGCRSRTALFPNGIVVFNIEHLAIGTSITC